MKLHTHVWIGLLASLLPLAAPAYDGAASAIARTEGASQVVAVSSGVYHSCGLQADGGVRCWGDNTYGQAGYHADGPYLAVSSGGYHSCGLKSDGSVRCWGNNGYGQASVPAGAGPFVSVSAGGWQSCGLKADGSVRCWGAIGQDYGQAGDHNDGPYVAISASWYHSCGLKADGSVHCWGYDPAHNFGQGGDHTDGPYIAVSTGAYHSCGLKADGGVRCWGSNFSGQAGNHDDGPYLSVATGDRHSCGLKADGSVHCWGENTVGQAGDHSDGPYVAVSAGDRHSCGLKADGSVACWGAGAPGSSGGINYGQSTVPAELQAAGNTAFGQIAAGNAHACELKSDGTIACWGTNDEGQATAPAGQFTQVVAGDSHSCAIGTDGNVTCWGRNATGNTLTLAHPLYAMNAFPGFEYPGGENGVPWKQLAPASDGAICALRADGKVIGCTRASQATVAADAYRNITRGLNLQDGAPSACAVRASGFGTCAPGFDAAHGDHFAGPWQRLESGLNHQCGLKANGNIECWGDNGDGQTATVPSGQFRALSTGWNHACAIKADGQLACWGSNLNGQADAPAGEYVQVAAGNTFTCAIRSDGERVCWGASPGNPAALSDLPNGVAGQAYGTQLAISGPSAPSGPVFVLMSGALPPGLALSSAGLLAGTPTSTGTYTFTVDAEGTGGFAATRSYDVTIIADTTAPVIDYTLTSSSAGNNGWYTGDVTISWSVADSESTAVVTAGCGIGFVDTLASDTIGATFSCSATSAGGTSSVTTETLKRDATPPTITATATTAASANGWYSGNVTIHFTCSDATSGVVSCPVDQVLTASGSSATPTIQDNAGNVSLPSNAVTVQIDTSSPVVGYAYSPLVPDGANGWYRGDVGIDWTAADPDSGLASSSGCADTTLSSDTAGASWTCTATNNAGLQASVTTSTIKRDGAAPTLSPTTPSLLLRGQSYSASPNAADVLSGLASASCGALDTSSTGSKSTSCSATDNAGNSRTVTLNYTVTTTCSNDGYTGTQLTWCRNICEMGYTGATLGIWIHRWINRYRDLPYCMVAPQLQ
ncbi:MAG TPA: putative Ig domain-containing protein [Thermomonas sp.]|nr:putative Ig domain-containing protein [Thermomonas sp.]